MKQPVCVVNENNSGKQISEAAISGLLERVRAMDFSGGAIPRLLVKAVIGLNNSLYQQFCGEAGTTLIAMLFYRNNAYWLSVGDSSIYLRRNGGLYRLNRNHTYLNQLFAEELEKEIIHKEDALRDEDAPRLSEFLGDVAIDSVTVCGKNDASVTSGSINRIITESGTGRKLLQIDVPIRGGNSGGPLVNQDGQVVGISTQGAVDDNNLNYAICIEDTFSLLRNNGIEFDYTSGNKLSTRQILLYSLLGLAAVVVVIVIVVLARSGKKKRHVEEPVPDNVPPVVNQSIPIRRAFVRSMSSQHNGMTVSLTQQPILIGRNPECRIVFLDNTKGKPPSLPAQL